MSVASVNRLLDEAYRVTNDAFARSIVDKAMQEVTVTRHNLIEAFKEAFIKEHNKEFPGLASPFEEEDPVFRQAASAAFRELDAHLRSKRTAASHVRPKTRNTIVFSQPRTNAAPFRVLKLAGIDVIQSALAAKDRAPLTDKQQLSVSQGIQRLHKNTTVGIARLAYTLSFLDREGSIKHFFSSKQYARIENKYGDYTADFEIIDQATTKGVFIKALMTVKLSIKAKSANFMGSEHKDWINVWPTLQKELRTWAKQQNWVDKKGSKSVKEKVLEKAEVELLKPFRKVKGVKVTPKPKKLSKITRKKQSKTHKGKPFNLAQRRDSRGRFISGRSKKEDADVSFITLRTLLNASLPDIVAKNMGLPALVWRTGRFSDSVRVAAITRTPKGFPSIKYTYMRRPYQIFEPTLGRAPWNTPERDPKRLIEKSIREIAMELAIGRFFTERI